MELNLVPADYERLQAEVHRLRLENASLQSEVRQLKNRLQVQDGSRENVATSTLPPEPLKEAEADPEQEYSDFNVTKQSDLQDKITLFRSFFRGREDVYALRRVDKTGKAGYFRTREYVDQEVPKPMRMYAKRRKGTLRWVTAKKREPDGRSSSISPCRAWKSKPGSVASAERF